MADLLEQGIAAARAGRRTEARQTLMQVVERDERNETAWLWLAGVLDDPEDIRTCLQNVLELNPDNGQAKRGLAWVDQRFGSRTAPPPPAADDRSAASSATLELPPRVAAAAAVPALEPSSPPEPAPVLDPAPPTSPALHAPAAPAPQLAPAMPVAAAEPTLPCAYCGQPTAPADQWCRSCRKSLLVRAPRDEGRRGSTTALGWLWIVNGVLGLLGSIAIGGLAFWASQQLGRLAGVDAEARAGVTVLVGAAVVSVLFSAGAVLIGRGVLRRQSWAWIVVAIFAAIGLFSFLVNLVTGTATAAVLLGQLGELGVPDRVVNSALGIGGAVLICSVAIQALYILLVALSFRDFFPQMVRVAPEVVPVDDREHFNNGLSYRDRGMWYAAVREWEAAVAKAPRDPNYLHALGLGYAQLGQFDRARRAIDTALQVVPNDPRIAESRAMVDRMAASAG